MLLLLIYWVIVTTVIYIIGFSTKEIIKLFLKTDIDYLDDEIFFLGFIIISLVASYLSTFIAVNSKTLLVLLFLTLIFLCQHRKKLLYKLKSTYTNFSNLLKTDKFFYISILAVILLVVSSGINTFDTILYHAQNIKWIREYPVVPGLGNLHGRLAFNSMFFPISALFTIDLPSIFDTKSILIYPLNSILFLLIIFKQISLIRHGISQNNWGQVCGSIVIVFLCLFCDIREISGTEPDNTVPLILIYLFQKLFYYKWNFTYEKCLLFASLIFLLITFKLSTAFSVLILIPFVFNKKWKIRIGIVSILGLIVVLPFLVRNYYSSGYLIYPFQYIDIFNVDWKIPIEKVIKEANIIEAWAKKPTYPTNEILNLSLNQWFWDWLLGSKDIKQIVIKNVSLLSFVISIFFMIYFFIKKNGFKTGVYLILQLNIIFCFLEAPSVTFAWGFIIILISTVTSDLIIFFYTKNNNSIFFNRYFFLLLVCSVLLVSILNGRREILYTLKNPCCFVLPEGIQETEVTTCQTNFIYYVNQECGCGNAPLPCGIIENKNLFLRGKTLKDGFYIKNSY